MGTQVLPAANGLLHMCSDPTDEDQPMVSVINELNNCSFQFSQKPVTKKGISPSGGTLQSSPCRVSLLSPSL